MSLNIDLLSLLLFTLSAHCQDAGLQVIKLSSFLVRVLGSVTCADQKNFQRRCIILSVGGMFSRMATSVFLAGVVLYLRRK